MNCAKVLASDLRIFGVLREFSDGIGRPLVQTCVGLFGAIGLLVLFWFLWANVADAGKCQHMLVNNL